MRALNLEDLVPLSESEAVQKHFDLKNYAILRWVLAGFGAAGMGLVIAAIVQKDALLGGCALANLVIVLCLFTLRETDPFARYFRHLLLIYLALQLLLIVLPIESNETAVVFAGFLFPLGLLLLRLRIVEYLLVLGSCWFLAVILLYNASITANKPLAIDSLIGMSVVIGLVLLIAGGLTRRQRRLFLADFRRESAKNRERQRMRQEIETARRIQIGMLPQSAPEVAWIDFAAASLPATEVGGDYYDYFELGPKRLALVIGDVSGHGLASGLVLSGVRSGLYLLEPELERPVAVLERLDRMVRQTSDRRTFVTLLCAVLDVEDEASGTLTVASAGHPPLLHLDRRLHRVEEVGHGALPLGTRLPARYQQDRRGVGRGDLLVLYTDGLTESTDGSGREYGDERLRRALARAESCRTAREARDLLLEDLSRFKGDGEQLDDITLVVVRLR